VDKAEATGHHRRSIYVRREQVRCAYQGGHREECDAEQRTGHREMSQESNVLLRYCRDKKVQCRRVIYLLNTFCANIGVVHTLRNHRGGVDDNDDK